MGPASLCPANPPLAHVLQTQLGHRYALVRRIFDGSAKLARLNLGCSREATSNTLTDLSERLHGHVTTAPAALDLSAIEAYLSDTISIALDMQAALRIFMSTATVDGSKLWQLMLVAPWTDAGNWVQAFASLSSLGNRSPDTMNDGPLWRDQVVKPVRSHGRAKSPYQPGFTDSINDRRV